MRRDARNATLSAAIALIAAASCADEVHELKLVIQSSGGHSCQQYLLSNPTVRSVTLALETPETASEADAGLECRNVSGVESPERLAETFNDRGYLVHELSNERAELALAAYAESCPASAGAPDPRGRLYCVRSEAIGSGRAGKLLATLLCPDQCPGAPSSLACEPPTKLADEDTPELREPALSSDRRRLYTRSSTKPWVLTRGGYQAPFELPWRPATEVPDGLADLSFFSDADEQQWVIAAHGTVGSRTLRLCRIDAEGWVCNAADVEVLDADSGAVVSGDFDGASVAWVAGKAWIAFNVHEKVYVGSFTDQRFAQIEAREVTEIDIPDLLQDDPGLDHQGTTLMFDTARTGTRDTRDLWVAFRDGLEEPWSTPVPVYDLNTPDGDEGGPELSRADVGKREVFFERDHIIYQTVCSRSALKQ